MTSEWPYDSVKVSDAGSGRACRIYKLDVVTLIHQVCASGFNAIDIAGRRTGLRDSDSRAGNGHIIDFKRPCRVGYRDRVGDHRIGSNNGPSAWRHGPTTPGRAQVSNP